MTAAFLRFNCVQRGHQNSLEGLANFLALMLSAGLFYPRAAAAAGLVYNLGAVRYMVGIELDIQSVDTRVARPLVARPRVARPRVARPRVAGTRSSANLLTCSHVPHARSVTSADTPRAIRRIGCEVQSSTLVCCSFWGPTCALRCASCSTFDEVTTASLDDNKIHL